MKKAINHNKRLKMFKVLKLFIIFYFSKLNHDKIFILFSLTFFFQNLWKKNPYDCYNLLVYFKNSIIVYHKFMLYIS